MKDKTESITDLILTTASKVFGITAVKPFQLLVMQRIVEQDSNDYIRRDQLVTLPTGTGKSLCFHLPALLCTGITIAVYPLLALMNDQIRNLKELGIETVCIRGGQTVEQRNRELKKLDEGAKIVITNPESLCYEKTYRIFENKTISLLVCDEAHVISQWGQTFRPSYLKLHAAVLRLKPRQVLAFTATADLKTIRDIKRCIFSKHPLIIKGNPDRDNIFYSTYRCTDRKAGLIELLNRCEKPAIVFCRKRLDTKVLCYLSRRINHNSEQRYYHAGLSKEERENLENWFFNSNEGVLFSTNAYGMGVNKTNIRTVIHYTLPSDALSYLQESGRAGRDGLQSHSYALVTYNDTLLPHTPGVLEVFRGTECRRQGLLSMLGVQQDECSGCDICAGAYRTKNVDTYDSITRAVLQTVTFNPFRFNSKKLCELLCGITGTNADRISPWFGLLRGFDMDLTEGTIRKLTADREHPLRPLGSIKLPKRGFMLFRRFSKKAHV